MNSKTIKLTLALLVLLMSAKSNLSAQTYNKLLGQNSSNVITTAVPFLMIAPDSRAGSMGDIGVSTSPDANSQHWNAAKYPFIENKMGFSLSYSPWLRSLIKDINLSYLTGYYKINDMSAISGSLRYFSLGTIQFTDQYGNVIQDVTPNEFAIDAAYSRKLGENISGAVTFRYINSNLTKGQIVNNQITKAGNAFAADIAIYYNKDIQINTTKGKFAFGANISNIGTKISYSESLASDFLPMNLRFGPSLTLDLDQYNTITMSLDINKLLVPTPPIYETDSNGTFIIAGKDPNRSVGNSIFTSWSDAPGGFKEEMQEFYFGTGIEYSYDKNFFLRGGYFYENAAKGNRKYFTLGAGFKYNVLSLDFSYLIPTTQHNPLQNTLRFSILFNFDQPTKAKK